MDIKDVTLGKIAVAVLLFDSLTPYNASLAIFRSATGDRIDLAIQEHRDALMHWLNAWGCRHLSKDQHQVASKSILDWYQRNCTTLFSDKIPLWQLKDQEIETVANVYGSLKEKTGARHYRYGNKLEVHIGPTAASKVLFAIRPKALMPWDEAMRVAFKCDGSPESYFKYLIEIRGLTLHIGELCRNKGLQIDELPQRLGRSNSTLLALVNEYIWVTVTRKVDLPSSKTLTQWASLG
jgi:hypothetical protein